MEQSTDTCTLTEYEHCCVCLCVLLGLSMEQSTDTCTLAALLQTVENQLCELTVTSRTRYDTKQHRDELKSQLDSSTAYKDQLQARVDGLRVHEMLLRTAVLAVRDCVHIQLQSQSVADAVVHALNDQHSVCGM